MAASGGMRLRRYGVEEFQFLGVVSLLRGSRIYQELGWFKRGASDTFLHPRRAYFGLVLTEDFAQS